MKKRVEKEILRETEKMLEDRNFQQKHVENPGKDFSRAGKLGFAATVKFVLGNARASLAMSSEEFAKTAKIGSVSAAAICKARGKIKYTAWKELFDKSAKLFPVQKTCQGYQVVAIDGMEGEMPNLMSLKGKYPVNSQTQYPHFHAISAYDVLNHYFMAVDFLPSPANEHQMAADLMAHPILAKQGQEKIFVFDRGFPCVGLIQKLEEQGHKFVMRVSRKFLKEINAFWDSKAVDKTLSISIDRRRGKASGIKARLPYTFSLRCVRIHLPSGEEEVCITNLPRLEFPKRKIRELYKLRWGIEVGYNFLKNTIFIEEFTSKKENGIKQDFYSSLWAANFIEALLLSVMPDPVKKHKLTYLPNRRYAAKRVYQSLWRLFFSSAKTVSRILSSLDLPISRNLSPIRSGRHFPRIPNSASHSPVHSRACLS